MPSRIGSSACFFSCVCVLGLSPASRGSLGIKAALAPSVSSSAGNLALPALLCLALPYQSVWSGKLLLCISFHLSLDLSTGMIFSIPVCVTKEGKELQAGCRTPHGSSETIRQQIEQLNCMQHQTRFSTLLSRRSLCGCTSLCLPCRAPKSVSSHPLAWLKVARKMHVFHWTRSVSLSINKCVQASVRQLPGLVVFWIFVGLPFTHLYP